MALFNVDQNKCKRDGICVDECPFGIIEMNVDLKTSTWTDSTETQNNYQQKPLNGFEQSDMPF